MSRARRSRRSSPWSARPRPARPACRSTSPSGSTARSSTPTRWRSTAAWTSAPPSRPESERRGIPHHLLDLLDVTEPLTVAEFQGWARAVIAEIRGRRSDAGPGRRLGALHAGGARPVRVPRHRSRRTPRARGRARPGRRAALCTVAWPRPIPTRPPGSCPTTAAGSSGRSRSSAITGPAVQRHSSPSTSTSTRAPSRSASTSTDRPSTRGSSSGCARCSTPASSTRYDASSTPVSPTAAPPAPRSATARSRRTWPARRPSTRRSSRRPPRPAASRVGRTAGSARTRA